MFAGPPPRERRTEGGERQRRDATAPRVHRRNYSGSLSRQDHKLTARTLRKTSTGWRRGGVMKGRGQLLWNYLEDLHGASDTAAFFQSKCATRAWSWTKAHEMDDFNGEVSRTEVVGIEPREQAVTHSFARCDGQGHLFYCEPVSVSLCSVWWYCCKVDSSWLAC